MDENGRPQLIKWNANKFAKDTTFTIPALTHKIFGYFISAYLLDENKVFWFATTQGLYAFNPSAADTSKIWKRYGNIPNDPSSLTYDYLLAIVADPYQPEKYLWLGSDGGGLSRFDKNTGKFTNYTEKDGLPNNVIYSLLCDSSNNIWMSTNRGLCCMYANKFKSGVVADKTWFRNFTSEDGLPGDEFNRQDYFKLPNGDLSFFGPAGGVYFTPGEVLAAGKPPHVEFTGLSVFNQPVNFKVDSNILTQSIAYAKQIVLPSDKNMFTLSFAVLEYRSNSSKQYKYYLDGYDKQWIESGSKNEATYTNLSPGTYTFHVKGASSTGLWNETDTTIDIIILPAWYQTWWFRLFVAIVVVVAVYTLYRYRLGQQLKLLNIRNRIASDLHDEIGSTISSISLSSNVIQKKLNGNSNTADVKKLVAQISDNTTNIMEVISDIVWTINTKNDSFANVIDRMRAFAVEILESKNISIHFDIDESANQISIDMDKRKNLYLIFKETINNAAKYSQCNNVWIEIKLIRGRVRLLVRDDGIGFNINEKQKSKLSGNGLFNMQKRAHDMKGKLVLDSQPQQGTTMLLEFGV